MRLNAVKALTGAALLSFSGGAAAATGAQGSFGLAAMVHTPKALIGFRGGDPGGATGEYLM